VTTSTISRTERRKGATRDRLLAAAARIYAEAGVDGATISAITERADVGLGTFYLHFKDKDAIAVAVAEGVLARIADAAREAATHADPDDPLAMHRAATRAVCRVAEREAKLLHALYRWHGRTPAGTLRQVFIGRLRTALERGMAAGVLRAENPDLAAHAVLGLYAESILYWASSRQRDWEALAEFLERASLGALACITP
jgi:AcrR family transcriptional regulator